MSENAKAMSAALEKFTYDQLFDELARRRARQYKEDVAEEVAEDPDLEYDDDAIQALLTNEILDEEVAEEFRAALERVGDEEEFTPASR